MHTHIQCITNKNSSSVTRSNLTSVVVHSQFLTLECEAMNKLLRLWEILSPISFDRSVDLIVLWISTLIPLSIVETQSEVATSQIVLQGKFLLVISNERNFVSSFQTTQSAFQISHNLSVFQTTQHSKKTPSPASCRSATRFPSC